jgi:hypothetical protein
MPISTNAEVLSLSLLISMSGSFQQGPTLVFPAAPLQPLAPRIPAVCATGPLLFVLRPFSLLRSHHLSPISRPCLCRLLYKVLKFRLKGTESARWRGLGIEPRI